MAGKYMTEALCEIYIRGWVKKINAFFFNTGITTDAGIYIIHQNEVSPLWITSLLLNLVTISLNSNVPPSNESMYPCFVTFCWLFFEPLHHGSFHFLVNGLMFAFLFVFMRAKKWLSEGAKSGDAVKSSTQMKWLSPLSLYLWSSLVMPKEDIIDWQVGFHSSDSYSEPCQALNVGIWVYCFSSWQEINQKEQSTEFYEGRINILIRMWNIAIERYGNY